MRRLKMNEGLDLKIPTPYLLEDLRRLTEPSIGKSQQRFIRVCPKGMGEKEIVLKIRKTENHKVVDE